MTKNKKPETDNLIPSEIIESKILLLRGEKVVLDKDLTILSFYLIHRNFP